MAGERRNIIGKVCQHRDHDVLLNGMGVCSGIVIVSSPSGPRVEAKVMMTRPLGLIAGRVHPPTIPQRRTARLAVLSAPACAKQGNPAASGAPTAGYD
jgi:hypothetical protein